MDSKGNIKYIVDSKVGGAKLTTNQTELFKNGGTLIGKNSKVVDKTTGGVLQDLVGPLHLGIQKIELSELILKQEKSSLQN